MLKFLFPAILDLSCTISVYAQTNITLRIDPDNAHGGTASQIFDTICFIPLETTKQSLFGTIDQLEVTDSFFIILDVQSRSVLLFNRDGRLHTRIKSDGSDKYFGYFAVDRDSKNILIANNYADGTLIYDFDGKFLGKRPVPPNARISSLYKLSNNTILYNLRRSADGKDSKRPPFDLAYSKNEIADFQYLNKYNPNTESGEYNIDFNQFNFSGQPGSCMFSLPFNYKVYQLNDTGIIRTYNFIFPAQYSLPPNFSTDPAFKGERAKYVYLNQENKLKKHGIGSTYHINDYLLFTAMNSDLHMGADLHYLYNLKTGSLISFSKVSGDSASCYFPILSSIFEPIGTVYNNKIYTSTPSFRIFGAKNQIDKPVQYPASIQNFMATGSKDNNRVIVELVLKQNL